MVEQPRRIKGRIRKWLFSTRGWIMIFFFAAILESFLIYYSFPRHVGMAEAYYDLWREPDHYEIRTCALCFYPGRFREPFAKLNVKYRLIQEDRVTLHLVERISGYNSVMEKAFRKKWIIPQIMGPARDLRSIQKEEQ
jgi:hypothetical protein